MESFLVNGGNRLVGEVKISGAKNAAVAVISATLLSDSPCVIENIPNIRDVQTLFEILTNIGVEITKLGKNTVEINPTKLTCPAISYEAAKKIRASYYLLGVLLGCFKHAQIAMPGGCNLGTRPIDQHIKGLEALGVDVKLEHGMIKAKATEIVGNSIYFDTVSVGATINVMLAAVKAKGSVVLENAAKEPHVVDTANFLNSIGADIIGAGTDVIRIKGVNRLSSRSGCSYTIIPDQIEAGTFMLCSMTTYGDITIKNIIPKHLFAIIEKLKNCGAEITEFDDSLRIKMQKRPLCAKIKTMPYPGFPTDMQPQVVAMLSLADGVSMVTESIWENRFKYVNELIRLGANLQLNGRTVVIEGTKSLTAAPVKATDLRAGAALLIAALATQGTTEIENIYHIERGYDSILEKLKKLGANISKYSK